ncbi:DUF349 domain-containing protein [Corynebacterium sp. P7202]|uniref:DUF349 domain-containing protein n=1 Tax=Corynebacterium pygosceleis TaxID=2800406 RepID=A0A9Q4C604_9CORY|nr:DUF349 domain-containing protein [Corynebacterium pygosceleis]MCK7636856.1 DUF349 domain-containing protein [Corynebacterium pygosceleis]MCX7443919.1 DUF349 domain-containing protein [Corynebacterium pygosceleis]MCX7467609.1 DUF349 domain-containing protein [Corynebacterium pygosceleis]
MSTNPTPKPGPRPGPRPGAMPAVRPKAPAAPLISRSDPTKWGRVDEDGNVYVTTRDGERLVGSWQAGTPEEGLAHYGVRFDDLATEVELLETRLRAHPDEAQGIRETAVQLREGLPTAAVVGDLEGLDERLARIIDESEEAGERARAEKEERRAKAISRKEELATEAEEIGESSTEWKAAGDRLREILTEWKSIRGIDRKTDDALWKRYSRARDAFNRRRGSHFAELDRGRAAARRAKEALVERAEALKNSTDWNETARAFRDLMTEWKAAGRAPREVDDKLWAAFKAAQDHFFEARNALNEEREREFEENANRKEALLAEYEPQIRPEDDLDGARAKLRELQERWEEIGFVPRARIREFEDRIGAVERRVSDAADDQWRRTDPAAQARAAQFEEKVRDFTAQAEAAEARGDAGKAEQLRAQAAQWSEWADAARAAVGER